ncbi:MAG: hypothetical protein BGO31_00265 [Bacteroidetes bacterium 43-16]|uniref:site-specific integrase n=1 Tax=Bacteroidota TaxID=976 RepID=UPI00092A58B7|nr:MULTISPECIES: site-specific integrase [Bacteroidota]OJV51673.1 MAG: hypothetical protein BGO31_00265 [Bacteroidetes bacterium 43-16]
MSTKKSLEVKLFHYDADITKEWYVGFRMECPTSGKRKPFQIRLGINYEHTVKSRMRVGNDLVELVKQSLDAGWDPFDQPLDIYLENFQTVEVKAKLEADRVEAERIERLGLVNCLQRAFKNREKSFAKKSRTDIEGVLNFAVAAATTLGLDKMIISEARKSTVKAILDQIAIDRQAEYDLHARLGKRKNIFTGNSYNKYKGYLSILFADIEGDDLIEFNPCAKIKNRREIKTNIHRHATEEERTIIVSTLKTNHYRFYKFLSTIHAAGVRIEELMSFKIFDIDHVNKGLKLDHTIAKTDESRIVPLPLFAYDYICEMTDGYPDHYYIFNTDFKPGTFERKRPGDYATKKWREIIKEGLGLSVSLYSFKGLGGEDKRKAGVSKGAVSAGFGHSSLNMTDVYLHGEQDRINAEIRERSPEL